MECNEHIIFAVFITLSYEIAISWEKIELYYQQEKLTFYLGWLTHKLHFPFALYMSS